MSRTSQIYLFCILLILVACEQKGDKINHCGCAPSFFQNQKKIQYNNKDKKDSTIVFRLNGAYNLWNYCGYSYTFNSFGRFILTDNHVEGDFNSSNGFIFLKKLCVYMVPIHEYYSPYPIKLFDFNLKINESFSFCGKDIYRVGKIKPIWFNYICSLEDIFVNNFDSVFKFRYKNLCFFDKDDQLVIFVSKTNGIIGIYISYYPVKNEEIILYFAGNICSFQ